MKYIAKSHYQSYMEHRLYTAEAHRMHSRF